MAACFFGRFGRHAPDGDTINPMTSRFVLLVGLVLGGGFCLAQQPAAASGASEQSSAQSSNQSQSGPSQSQSGQASSKQTAPGQPAAGSTSSPAGQGSGSQGSAGQNSAGQGSATPGSATQGSDQSSSQSSSSSSPPGDSSAKQSSSPGSDLDRDADESSSRDEPADISPPPDDAKAHPDSKTAVGDLLPSPASNANSDTSDIQEFHPWNPMKALKDIEIGDYYFRRKNYRAAMDRYKEAIFYKENDAVATYRLAVCEEKLGQKDEARKNFEQYLKILPEGPLAKEARASLGKLGGRAN